MNPLTIEDNENLLPLCVAHLGRLAEKYLVFVAHKDAVEDELAQRSVCEVPERGVLANVGQKLQTLLRHRLPV